MRSWSPEPISASEDSRGRPLLVQDWEPQEAQPVATADEKSATIRSSNAFPKPEIDLPSAAMPTPSELGYRRTLWDGLLTGLTRAARAITRSKP